jgi:CRP/FNR family transcriptional regulator, cyclic AMP receptor protein
MTNGQPELLKGLGPAEAEAVMALGTRRALSAGAVLFKLGAPADEMYLITRGRVALTLPMQVFGRSEDVLVEERLQGETIGWSALIPPHRFTLKASAPLETEVLAFSRGALVEHFASRPAVGHTVIRNVAAVIGHRLQVLQAMWLRQMQQMVELRSA